MKNTYIDCKRAVLTPTPDLLELEQALREASRDRERAQIDVVIHGQIVGIDEFGRANVAITKMRRTRTV